LAVTDTPDALLRRGWAQEKRTTVDSKTGTIIHPFLLSCP
jgi:hypothetical protein